MRPRRLLTRQTVLLSGVLLTAASCSFLYDLDQVQCEIRADCAGFHPASGEDVACIQGVCTYVSLTTSSSGGTTGNPTSTSTTGTAGAGGLPGCQTNDECIDENYGNPTICRDGECIPLASDECPIVLGVGDDNLTLKDPREPFIFGAYAKMGDPVLEDTAATANYDFAINQVNTATGNGYSYAGARRPFIAVVCNDIGDIASSMQHLVKTLEVPGIISTLGSSPLLEAFENQDYGARENNVFMLSTTYADSTLTNPDVDPNALLWHMLGDGDDQAAAYKPLVAQAEAYLRAQRSIPDEEPIRVVMVVSDDPYVEDVARVITSTIVFNGQSAVANADEDCGDGEFVPVDTPCFQRVNIDSITAETPNPDVNDAYTAIFNNEPQLVLAITRSEFLLQGLLPTVEDSWDGAKAARSLPPPMYLFSPRISRNATLPIVQKYEMPTTGNNSAFTPLRQRILGVAPAGADNTTLYDEYLLEFEQKYDHLVESGIVLTGTENFYDAAYFMMYAIHGGVAVNNLTGIHLSSGMQRLLGGGMDYDVGPDDANAVIKDLRSGDEDGYLTLNGTMGPPAFRPSGARINLPSIYCIDLDPEGTDDEMAFYPDVLKYNPEDESLSSPSGEDPCSIDGFLGEP